MSNVNLVSSYFCTHPFPSSISLANPRQIHSHTLSHPASYPSLDSCGWLLVRYNIFVSWPILVVYSSRLYQVDLNSRCKKTEVHIRCLFCCVLPLMTPGCFRLFCLCLVIEFCFDLFWACVVTTTRHCFIYVCFPCNIVHIICVIRSISGIIFVINSELRLMFEL